MKLRNIEGRNVKGRTFSHSLSDAVAIIGPNFAGKTAIPDAIRLAFMGHLPEVGKLPKSTWELSGGEEMAVEATFDNEAKLSRRFYLKSGTPASAAYADDGIPVSDLETIPLLNADHYFSLTDTQRTNYVFERITLPDTYSSAAIIAGIEQLSLGEAHTEQVEKAKQALVVDVRKCFRGGSIQDSLTEALELFRQRFTYWNARAKETQGAVRTLTELKLRENEISAESIAAIQRAIAEATEKKEDLDTRKGSLTQRRDGAERNIGQRRQLQKSLDADRTDYPRILEQKRAEKAELEKELLPDPKPEEIEKTRRSIASATQVINNADTAVGLHDKTIGDINRQLEGMSNLTECPYCHAKGKGWKKALEENLIERRTEIEERIRVATESRDRANDVLRDANETLDGLIQAQENNARLRRVIATTDSAIALIERDQVAENEKRTRWTTEISELPKPADVKVLEKELTNLHEERLAVANELSALNGKLNAARSLAQDLKRAAQAQIEHEDANAYVVMVKSIATYLKEKRSAIVTDVFKKLLAVANQLCGEILMTPLSLHEGTIGRWEENDRGAKFIPHRVFSGTEKALAYISIAIALSIDAPIRLPILDEFGRLDQNNQREVIRILHDLVKREVIDQFIIVGTDVSGPSDMKEGLQIIEVKP
jgi:DNA repair exonuclease SbcCD ATPase subunit